MNNPWNDQKPLPPPLPSSRPKPNQSLSGFAIIVLILTGFIIFIAIWSGLPSGDTNISASSTENANSNENQSLNDASHSVNQVGFNPDMACQLMDSFSMATSSYHPMYEGSDSYLCNSPYLDLGNEEDAVSSPNNLSYYVRGSSDTAYRLRILLNVNRPEESIPARVMLAEKSVRLTQAALNIDMPPKALAALQAGKQYKGKRKGYTIEVIRDNWKNGNGYSLEYVIRDPRFNKGK